MEFKDYYSVLGVEPDADLKAIKTAYRRLARQYHPDVSSESNAEDRFKEVTEAYEVLGDKDKRAEYDELRQYAGRGGGFEPPPGWQGRGGGYREEHVYDGDFSDFFNSIFGGGFGSADFGGGGFNQRDQGGGLRGQDVETDLPIFLEDTLSTESKTVRYHLPQVDAQGRRQAVEKTLKVKVPAGVRDGERIRLKGQGAPGVGGGAAGDLYLRIRLVPHPMFDVEGHNLVITVPVAPWEVSLGAKVTIPTLEGDIRITVPENSQADKRIRIKGKGLPGKQGRGDLYVVLKVVMPDTSDDDTRALWQQLSERAAFNPRAQWRK